MAEFLGESIRQISRLAKNSLRIGTGNLIGVSGKFRGGTGNSGPDQANGAQPGGQVQSEGSLPALFAPGPRHTLVRIGLLRGLSKPDPANP